MFIVTPCADVFSVGGNKHGQLGLGDTQDRTTALLVASFPSQVVRISSGANHSGALTGDGRMFLWGRSSFGQTGAGTGASLTSPTEVKVAPRVDLPEDGASTVPSEMEASEASQQGGQDVSPKRAPIAACRPRFVALALGENHTLALTDAKSLFACGSGTLGQLGRDDASDKLILVPMEGTYPSDDMDFFF